MWRPRDAGLDKRHCGGGELARYRLPNFDGWVSHRANGQLRGGAMNNAIKRSTKKLPKYFGRLFEQKADAQDWLERMHKKMGDYSVAVEFVRVDGFDVHHAYLWRE